MFYLNSESQRHQNVQSGNNSLVSNFKNHWILFAILGIVIVILGYLHFHHKTVEMSLLDIKGQLT